jgi:hypothetical protein
MEKRKSDRQHVYAGVFLSCVLLLLASAGMIGSEPAGPTAKDSPTTAAASASAMTVALREIPVWQVHEQVRSSFLTGLPSYTSPQADANVRYPTLKSTTPLYGRIGPGNLADAQREGNDSDRGGLFFVFDQPPGRSDSYDQLYFDENADGDLTNDTPHGLLRDVPAGLSIQDGRMVEPTWFERVKVTLPSSGANPRIVELLPSLWKREGRVVAVRFIPARIYNGRFEVNGQSYDAFLGYEYRLTASLNEPTSVLRLVSQDGKRASYLGVEQLNAMPILGGKYYRFSCTPTGDQLFVERYDGPLGILEIGPGRRNVKELQMTGELQSRTAVIGIGYDRLDKKGVPQGVRRCEIPIGDYYPRYMTVSLGKVRFAFSDNYYQSASGRTGFNPETRYNMAIRADKPFVLDFSNKPIVLFREPLTNGRPLLSPGTPLRIEAVLVDPVRNIMIRRLEDMSHPEKRSYKTPDGQEMTYEFGPSLDPKVTIARANGEIVTQGVMPFG